MTIRRREVLTGTAATGLLGPLADRSFAQASKSGTVRVWGEPGPYGGVAVAAMNEWAQKNAPALKFEIETIPWDGVYVKLMTDLAARRPPALISVESPLAMQLMAEELLVPLDDVADKVGRDRLVPGVKWDFWGAWKGKQYVIPAHHQPHLLLVRTDITRELGLSDPDTWTWADLPTRRARSARRSPTWLASAWRSAAISAPTITSPPCFIRPAGACSPRRTNLRWCSTARDRRGAGVRKRTAPVHAKGAVEYSFLQVVDAHVTGTTAMSFYWGRTLGRAAEEAKPVFEATEAFNHARHPKTGRRSNWNDFQGWIIPAQNNPYIEEVKQALTYQQTSKDWLVKYCHSLVPNVGAGLQGHRGLRRSSRTIHSIRRSLGRWTPTSRHRWSTRRARPTRC